MSFRESAFYRYHEATKHTLARLYADPHQLDWANQPDPFRRYDGATLIDLPRPTRPPPAEFFALSDPPAGLPPRVPLDLQGVANLLYYSMAISAWKEVPARGLRWSLRVNPSSGNLHPTETHLLAGGIDRLADGVYHFRVDEFRLERRWQGPIDDLLTALNVACELPRRRLTVVLTSIFWREAWKYRARAFRYCHHDLGHALASITEAARGLGWPATLRQRFDDDRVASLLGLAGGDERPGVLLSIGPDAATDANAAPPHRRFDGAPNALSGEVIAYALIDHTYEATRTVGAGKSMRRSRVTIPSDQRIVLPSTTDAVSDFWHVVRTRRSVLETDGETGISLDQLGTMLHRATRGADGDIFTARGRDDSGLRTQDSGLSFSGLRTQDSGLSFSGLRTQDSGLSFSGLRTQDSGLTFIHLYLYVHRVDGLPPGVYYYEAASHALIPLLLADVRREAAYLSLQQSIAANGAFAVSMVADFRAAYTSFGERGYRAVHIESGFIGQALYLGAESVGTNSTGIGAFFDDDVNRYLALPDGLEVIYHFTVGRAVPDPRLRTAPSYGFPDPAHA